MQTLVEMGIDMLSRYGQNTTLTLLICGSSVAMSACGHDGRVWRFQGALMSSVTDVELLGAEPGTQSSTTRRQRLDAQAATRVVIDAFFRGHVALCGGVNLRDNDAKIPIVLAPVLQPTDNSQTFSIFPSIEALSRSRVKYPLRHMRFELLETWMQDKTSRARLTCSLDGLVPEPVIRTGSTGGFTGTLFPTKTWHYDVLWKEDGGVTLVGLGLPSGIGANH